MNAEAFGPDELLVVHILRYFRRRSHNLLRRILMTRVLLLFVTLFSFSTAGANSPEIWKVKSVTCASGQLLPENAYQVGQILSGPGVQVNIDATMSLLETDEDAVWASRVSGDGTSACQNNGTPTILIITLKK